MLAFKFFVTSAGKVLCKDPGKTIPNFLIGEKPLREDQPQFLPC
jgi:hypothetical protein